MAATPLDITGPPMSSRAQAFGLLIGEATSLVACSSLRAQLIRLLRANSIRYTEGTLLQSALADQAAALFNADHASLSASGQEAIPIGEFIDQALIDLPANRLYARLASHLPCHIVIDGHNLIFRLSVLFRHLFDNGRPGSAAKGLLVERLQAAVMQAETLWITLWFDGAVPSIETPHPRLTVRYSGGTGPDRADKEIVAYLKACGPESPCPLFLVTDDVDEARRVRKTGVQVLQCGEFRRMVTP